MLTEVPMLAFHPYRDIQGNKLPVPFQEIIARMLAALSTTGGSSAFKLDLLGSKHFKIIIHLTNGLVFGYDAFRRDSSVLPQDNRIRDNHTRPFLS
jgi:hypothetical protein